MMWNSSQDLLASIHEAHTRLKLKETDATSAHAEARLLGAATRVLAITLEHARLTNRLTEGSCALPGMTFSPAAIEGEAVPQKTLAGAVAG